MDCRTALETLDLCAAGFNGPETPVTESAVEHVRCCPECKGTFERRRALDERIGRELRDVPIPPRLKERLLSALSEGAAETSLTTVDSSRQRPSRPGSLPVGEESEVKGGREDGVSRVSESCPSAAAASAPSAEAVGTPRRRRLETAVTTAACLLAGLAVWYLSGLAHPQYTLEDLQHWATQETNELPEFAGDFEARVPAGWPSANMQIASVPKGWPSESRTHHIALYEFRFRSRGRTWRGVLLVAPKREVVSAPSTPYFPTAEVGYISSPAGRFATAAWTERDFVYVCAVNGGADVMEALQRALEQPPA